MERDIAESLYESFQFLIGRLGTGWEGLTRRTKRLFQFLIGRLGTKDG